MAALDTTALDDGSTAACPHPGAEAVLALTAAYIGLVGAFHNKEVQVGGSRSALGYEPRGDIVKGESAFRQHRFFHSRKLTLTRETKL